MAQRNTFRDDEDLEEKINMRDLARVGVYLKPYMARVVWILIVVAAMGCINVVEPYLTKIMIDSVIPAKNLALLGELVALLAVLIVIYEFGLRYRTVEITRVGQLMLKDMRRDLFTHIQTLPFSYFDSRPHGKILIRVVNYVNTLSDTLSSGLVNVISDVFTFFITLVVMFVVDWRLALYSLALFPLLIAWVLGLQHFQRRAYQVLSNKQSNLNAFIHESIAGVKTTQTFAREDTQFRTFQEQQGAVRSAWMRTVHIQTLMWPGIQTISVMTIAFIYYVGVTGFGGVDVTTGVLIAFVGYANNFWNPVISIGNFYNQLITCSAYLERIFETLDPQRAGRRRSAADRGPRRLQRRRLPLRAGRPQHPEPGRPACRARQDDRAGRSYGCRQNHDHQPAVAFLRRRRRLGDDRRPRRAFRDVGKPAPADGRHAAGHVHLLRQRA